MPHISSQAPPMSLLLSLSPCLSGNLNHGAEGIMGMAEVDGKFDFP